MAKYCDFCGNKIGIRKLKYKEGYVCKECYYILSNQYKNVIKNKTKVELDKVYSKYKKKFNNVHKEEFNISEKIGNYLLVDRENEKICIPNNISVVGTNHEPVIITMSNVKSLKIKSNPNYSNEIIEQKISEKKEDIVKTLYIEIMLKQPKKIEKIILLNKPVRISSFAFKKSYSFAQRIAETLEQMINRV